MRVLDLFSGIGGFSLGLERAGMKTVAFCEIDPYCRAVLKKHWPGVPIFEDVRKLTNSDVPGADVICGGFPCQDISSAGKGLGFAGERSGLWRDYSRLIGTIRPRFAVMENVTALLWRGLGRVLGDLAEVGYDCQWHCIPASVFGAPHERDRIWIIAYPHSAQREGRRISSGIYQEYADACRSGRWEAEPGVCRVDDGTPNRAHRLKSVGNAVVPVIPEIIGRAIMRASNDF